MLGSGVGTAAGLITSGAMQRSIDAAKAKKELKKEEKAKKKAEKAEAKAAKAEAMADSAKKDSELLKPKGPAMLPTNTVPDKLPSRENTPVTTPNPTQ